MEVHQNLQRLCLRSNLREQSLHIIMFDLTRMMVIFFYGDIHLLVQKKSKFFFTLFSGSASQYFQGILCLEGKKKKEKHMGDAFAQQWETNRLIYKKYYVHQI